MVSKKTDGVHIGIIIGLITVVILLFTTIGTATYFLGGMKADISNGSKASEKTSEEVVDLRKDMSEFKLSMKEGMSDMKLDLQAISIKLGVDEDRVECVKVANN